MQMSEGVEPCCWVDSVGMAASGALRKLAVEAGCDRSCPPSRHSSQAQPSGRWGWENRPAISWCTRPGVSSRCFNGRELAIVYCFVFLYFWIAGGGEWSLDRLNASSSAPVLSASRDLSKADDRRGGQILTICRRKVYSASGQAGPGNDINAGSPGSQKAPT